MARTRRGGSSMAVNSKHLETGMGRIVHLDWGVGGGGGGGIGGVREARGRGRGWGAEGGGGGGAAVANQYLEFRYTVHVYK